MNKLKIIVILLTLSFSYAGIGRSGAKFLKEDFSARTFGMGQAFCAIADDVTGIHFNPGGFNHVIYPEFAIMYYKSLMDTFYSRVGFLYPLKKGTIGTSVFIFDGGNIEVNYLDGRTDILKAGQDIVITLGYGTNIAKKFFYGANMKLISSQLASKHRAFSIAFDSGLIVHLINNRFSIGLSLLNLGPGLKYISTVDPLPINLRSGVAYRVLNDIKNSLIIAGDFVYDIIESRIKFNLGSEYTFMNLLSIRAGYKLGYGPNMFSIGLGLKIFTGQINYAYAPLLDENTHRVSFILRFGKFKEKSRH